MTGRTRGWLANPIHRTQMWETTKIGAYTITYAGTWTWIYIISRQIHGASAAGGMIIVSFALFWFLTGRIIDQIRALLRIRRINRMLTEHNVDPWQA